jgi:arylsulfatase
MAFGLATVVNTVAHAQEKKLNIVIIWGADIGQSNVSAYSHGLMGYQTPNIDRVAKEGMVKSFGSCKQVRQRTQHFSGLGFR